VEITVSSYSSRKVYLLGRVVKPGVYPLYQNTTLLDILSEAGGLANPGAGRYAYVIRKSVGNIREGGKIEEIMMDKEPLKIDLERLLDEGDVSRDRRLENGDVIYIPAQESADLWEENICVMGEVNSPGVYPMKRGLTAMTACLLAGGFTDFAAPNRAKLMRVEKGQQKTIKINLKKVMEGKERDVPVKAGDRIYVPESWL
jgi:polysaccharide export outer membrane protein